MNLIDRLILKAENVKLAYGDNVFIISNRTGEWMVDGQVFPDLEAAKEYVDGLLPDGDPESVVIIDDLGPANVDEIEQLDMGAWLKGIREQNYEERRQERAKELLNRTPMKNRWLI